MMKSNSLGGGGSGVSEYLQYRKAKGERQSSCGASRSLRKFPSY